MFDSLRELFQYRNMIGNLVKREIRGRYKGSVLGFFWNFITPLIQILVYIIVFTAVFKPGIENYSVYLISGMIIWIWFSESSTAGSGTLVANGSLLKKIYFPRSVLPISIVLSKMVNFIIMIALYSIIIAIMDYGFSLEALLCLPLVMLISFFFILGFVMVTSAIDVFLRDTQYIITVAMMAWIWLTPIMYSTAGIENGLMRALLNCNPMTYITSMYQSIFYWKCVPSMSDVIVSIICSLILMAVGTIVFKHLEGKFAEVL